MTQIIFSSAFTLNLCNVLLSFFIFKKIDEKRMLYIDRWVKRSKVKLSVNFLLNFISDGISLSLFRLYKTMNEADWKSPRTSKDKRLLVKVSNGCFSCLYNL